MSVASLQDVLRGKGWAYSDETRRRSKRQKDLADILRLVETYPELARELPPNIAAELEEE
jgi:adenylosuccinate synthase